MYSIERLIPNRGTLAAKTEIYVPVVVTLIGDLPVEEPDETFLYIIVSGGQTE